MSTTELLTLIGEYFDLGVAEGREGRDHDTQDGAASRKWNEIRAALRASQSQQPAPAEPVAKVVSVYGGHRNMYRAIETLTDPPVAIGTLLYTAAAAVQPPVVPQRYLHVKSGGVYEVVCDEAKRESDCERLVVYRSATTGMVWVRPASEFFDGRFTEVRGQPPVVPTQAARDVLDERRRQIEAEGWSPEHDDEHDKGEMARAAATYALYDLGVPAVARVDGLDASRLWPWSWEWLKPKDNRRNLVRSAALILAEIERLDRRGIGSVPPSANPASVHQDRRSGGGVRTEPDVPSDSV